MATLPEPLLHPQPEPETMLTPPAPPERDLRDDASPLRPKLSREDEARLALERTDVAPGVARALAAAFLLTIFAVPLAQAASRLRRGDSLLPALDRASAVPRASELKSFASTLEGDSPVANWVLPRAQRGLASLGSGSGSALVGRGGWLLYKPDVAYLTGRPFLEAARHPARGEDGEELPPVQGDAVAAIARFDAQLKARGITLILLPTPLKPMIQPDALSARFSARSEPLQNPSYARFADEMKRRGIRVCDPTALLLQSRTSGQEPFLRADTHWTPQAMQAASAMLAGSIKRAASLPARPDPGYKRRQVLARGCGDLAAMLHLPDEQAVSLEQVVTEHGAPWRPSREADVLLLGDSFTNIFSRGSMGWGQGAGLAEQLSFELARPVDSVAINAGGAASTRQKLASDAARGDDRLRGKRVVVWQFAMRDLQIGDWKKIELPTSRPGARPQVLADANQSALPLLPPAPRPLPAPDEAGEWDLARFRAVLGRRANQIERTGSDVMAGRSGWLFYLPDAYYVSTAGFLGTEAGVGSHLGLGPASDPQVRALVDFGRQLKRRGIKLLVVPLPSKASVYSDYLDLGTSPQPPTPRAPQNPSMARFGRALEAQGIGFFDATATMLEQRSLGREPVFMPTDSHWTWKGMDAVAAQIARRAQSIVGKRALDREPGTFTRTPGRVRNITDISMMLPRLPGDPQFVRLQQDVQKVLAPGGALWQPDEGADVLVMGDSFTNIYSHGGYWGKGAGLGAQLSYYLQRPVDQIATDRGGANKTRLALQRDLSLGRGRLDGKKLVIYEVASRYLLSRQWKLIPLPLPKRSGSVPRPKPGPKYLQSTPGSSGSKSAVPDRAIWVRGTVRAASVVPAANSTPYGDMVMTVRLRDVRLADSEAASGKQIPPGDIVVYAWGLSGQRPTRAANWKKGQQIDVRLLPWRAVEDEFGSYDRSELDVDETAGLPEFWADATP